MLARLLLATLAVLRAALIYGEGADVATPLRWRAPFWAVAGRRPPARHGVRSRPAIGGSFG